MLYDPKRSWWPDGECQWTDPEPFFAPGGQLDRTPSPATQTQWNRAKEVCARCPVLAECRRDTLGEQELRHPRRLVGGHLLAGQLLIRGEAQQLPPGLVQVQLLPLRCR